MSVQSASVAIRPASKRGQGQNSILGYLRRNIQRSLIGLAILLFFILFAFIGAAVC